jgi:hypothetical protein
METRLAAKMSVINHLGGSHALLRRAAHWILSQTCSARLSFIHRSRWARSSEPEAEDFLYSFKTALNDSRAATVSTFGISHSDSSWNHPLRIWKMLTRLNSPQITNTTGGENGQYDMIASGCRSVAWVHDATWTDPLFFRCIFSEWALQRPRLMCRPTPRHGAVPLPGGIPTGPGADERFSDTTTAENRIHAYLSTLSTQPSALDLVNFDRDQVETSRRF